MYLRFRRRDSQNWKGETGDKFNKMLEMSQCRFNGAGYFGGCHLDCEERILAVEILDTLGLRSPYPVLKIAEKIPDLKRGELLEVWGDCAHFENDVCLWCKRLGKVVLSVNVVGDNKKKIVIKF